MDYFVYIAENPQKRLYIGQTTDPNKRIICHNTKRGSLFTTKYGGFRIVYRERYSSLVEAMRREKQLKGWSRKKKEALITGNLKLLKEL